MKQVMIITMAVFCSFYTAAQDNRYVSIAAFTTQNAMPFGKFAGLFGETFHPGVEAGFGRNMGIKQKHEWFIELKVAYFFHRYVQHGFPLYLNFGYRYKLSERLSAETSVGAGYMHSIPATSKMKLNKDGEYVNNKGAGRIQATVSYGLGLGYIVNPHSTSPVRLFSQYQQRVQMPFVKSYVPLLPYNSFMFGISKPISKK